MKIHYASLLDRHAGGKTLIIRAQDQRTGECFSIRVPPEHEDEAGRIWGGELVAYRCAGRHRIYVSHDEVEAEYARQMYL